MKDNSESFKPDQYFPTYSLRTKGARDIALAEYQSASQTLQGEEKIFTNAVNIITLSFTLLGSIFLLKFETISQALSSMSPQLFLILCVELNLFLFILALLYLSQRQKEIAFAARKIIVLRRMLGLSYGMVHLVLPNWRVEGASEPFSIPIFSGWSHYSAFPVYIISLVSAIILFILLQKIFPTASDIMLISIILIYWVYFLSVYRRSLFDSYETSLLAFTRILCKFIGLDLVKNFEFIIYRAKLSVIEINRIGIDTNKIEKIAVFLEDQTFYSHHGISLRGIGRAIIHYIKRKKKSGGSTITQQLVRSLFISSYKGFFRRKLAEILLALWAEKSFSKKDILLMYLASVRFERDVLGLPQAINHFFTKETISLSNAQAFFLVERLSNISSKFLSRKIYENIERALRLKILSSQEAAELLQIYTEKIDNHTIVGDIEMTPQDIALRLNI